MIGVLCGVLLMSPTIYGQMTSDMERLLSHLFNESRYKTIMRPVANISTVTQVNVSFSVYSLFHIDVTRGEVEVAGMFNISWFDELLVWDPDDYGGLQSMSVPEEFVWRPDLVLSHGTIDKHVLLGKTGFSPTWVYHTGHVNTLPGGNVRSLCKVDMSLYPFDSHVCIFSLVSARYGVREIILKTDQTFIDLGGFQRSSEWVVESTLLDVDDKESEGHVAMSYIEKRLLLKRRPAYVVIHTLVPEMLISFLNLATCYVPVDSGERLSFSITIFMSFVFLSYTYIQDLPRNATEVNFTSYSILLLNVINVLTVLWSITVIRISKCSTGQHQIPRCLRQIVKVCYIRLQNKEDDDNGTPITTGKVDSRESSETKDIPPEISSVTDDKEVATCERLEVTWHHCALFLDNTFFAILLIMTMSVYFADVLALMKKGII